MRDVEFHAGSVSSTEAIVLDNASRITLDQLLLLPDVDHFGLRITNSSVVTVSRSYIYSGVNGGGIHATQGTELTLARNTISYHVFVERFNNLAINGNRLYGRCGPALAVVGPSNTVSIQNNAFIRRPDPACAVNHIVEVDTAATPTTTLDYNNITHATDAYLWAGTSYDTPTDLHAATGQVAHDLVAPSSSLTSLHDNANADAPGALTETASPCAGSHVYANTGTYQVSVAASNASGLTKTLAEEITV